MNVSKRLISLRERCGFTQNGLAERAGVSQTHLRRVELGQADITIGHLQLLCDAMGISLKDFFEAIWSLSADQVAIISLIITLLLFVIGKISENRLKIYETRNTTR